MKSIKTNVDKMAYTIASAFRTRCYTLNITGRIFGYEQGSKVLETHHTVLGQHPETRQPTLLGLGLGQPTLRYQEVPGPSTGADWESASATAEEDNLGGHHKQDKQSEGKRKRKELPVEIAE